jgi:phosphoserine phosphatase
MSEIVLLKVSGDDKPGVLAGLADVLAAYGVRILDLSQAAIHDILSLSMLVEIPAESEAAPVFKRLLYRADELDVKLKFVPMSEERHAAWVHGEGTERHIVTLLAREITAQAIARLARITADNGLNIDFIAPLTGRGPLRGPQRGEDLPPRACVEFLVRGRPADPEAMRRAFLDLSRELGVDIAFQKDDVFRRNRRLVALDMDSTLIQAEVIDELAAEAGAGEEVSKVTEAAMRGEIDFKASLTRRVACLAGLPAEVLDTVAARIPLTEGAERLVRTLKAIGLKVAILSGGFTWFGKKLQERLGIDYLYANELEIKDGRLTGRLVGEIVDGRRKAELLRQIAEREGIRLEQVVAVGDGANDLPMLGVAGLGIAFHAKPVVTEGAGQAISTLGLDGILYLLGLRDSDTLD